MRPKHCCNVRHPGRCHRRVLRQAMQLLRPSGKVHFVLNRIEPAEALSDALQDGAETIGSNSAMIGVQTAQDKARANAKKAANQLGRVFTDCIESGRISKKGMYDRHDEPTPVADPQAHRSTFDCATADVLTLLREAALSAMPGYAYSGAVDNIRFFSAHNDKFSKPLTENCDTGPAKYRSKRIFFDKTGSGREWNRRAFCLQTHKRDSTKVMHDSSMPTSVKGHDAVLAIDRPARRTETDLAPPGMVSRKISTSLTGTG